MEDAEFYRQLLKEFLETIDPASSGIVKKNIPESLDMKPPLAIVMSNNSSVKSLFYILKSQYLPLAEAAFYEMKKFQTKKRKVVDRRASKSRKIR